MEFIVALKYLELNPGYTEAELKKAYRKKSKQYHPDMPNGGNVQLFNECTNAYEILRFALSQENNLGCNKRQDKAPKYRFMNSVFVIIQNNI